MQKIAFLLSHPIEYRAPLYKRLASENSFEFKVYYCWDFGVRSTYDSDFGKAFKWDLPLLDGYNYEFLRNYSLKPSSAFWGQINPGIITELIRNRYDGICIYGWNSFANWLAIITAVILGVPIYLQSESPLNQELMKSKKILKIKKIIFGWLFKRISGFLYIGSQNKDFYEYYGVSKDKLFFTPYAVDNERFFLNANRLLPLKTALRRQIGITSEQVVILFVGKLIEKKRPMSLLKAFNKLTYKNKALIFVGDGRMRPHLENFVVEEDVKNVHFTGFKNQLEINNYYAMADFLVLPSGMGETWGLVVNEAMCFGMPVIVSDVVGCSSDLVIDNENGFTVTLDDTDTLSSKILYLLSDEKMRKKFGINSLKRIKQYSYDADIDGINAALVKNL